MEERLLGIETNIDVLNTSVAVMQDRYPRLEAGISEIRSDVKTLLDRTARLEGPTHGGNSKLKGFIGGLTAMLVGIAGFLIDRR